MEVSEPNMDFEVKAIFTGTKEDWKILTSSEWVVFFRSCEGKAKKIICDYVCRSENTVKTQQTSIRTKFHVHTMAEATAKAVAKGIITITPLILIILPLLILLIVNVGGEYIVNDKLVIKDKQGDTRRAPRTVRTNRINQTFRDYIV